MIGRSQRRNLLWSSWGDYIHVFFVWNSQTSADSDLLCAEMTAPKNAVLKLLSTFCSLFYFPHHFTCIRSHYCPSLHMKELIKLLTCTVGECHVKSGSFYAMNAALWLLIWEDLREQNVARRLDRDWLQVVHSTRVNPGEVGHWLFISLATKLDSPYLCLLLSYTVEKLKGRKPFISRPLVNHFSRKHSEFHAEVSQQKYKTVFFRQLRQINQLLTVHEAKTNAKLLFPSYFESKWHLMLI